MIIIGDIDGENQEDGLRNHGEEVLRMENNIYGYNHGRTTTYGRITTRRESWG
jgi:hypothetical protein